jgi:hypothetical protein
MQDVDGLLELGDVDHTVDAACVPDANLSCTSTHFVERLPVGRLKPGLDLPQLEARFLPGVFWECQPVQVNGGSTEWNTNPISRPVSRLRPIRIRTGRAGAAVYW